MLLTDKPIPLYIFYFILKKIKLNFIQSMRSIYIHEIKGNNIAIYYQSFESLNCDDSVDTVPSQGV